MSDSQSEDDGGDVTLRWVFVRGDDRIDVCRSVTPTSTHVEISERGVMQAFRFPARATVVAFHAGFEQALLQTGWRVTSFEPERRRGSDRRAIPRGIDRRGAIALVWSR